MVVAKKMKRLTDDYTRINNVIQADKSFMSDACKDLVLQDFSEKFNEYFDLSFGFANVRGEILAEVSDNVMYGEKVENYITDNKVFFSNFFEKTIDKIKGLWYDSK